MKRDEDFRNESQQERKRQKLEHASKSNDVITLEAEWDDEFNDQLEEVCFIAECTQMPVPKDVPSHLAVPSIKRLEDVIKTKEGEVAILRSQLSSIQLARQGDAVQHLRAITDLQKKHNLEIGSTKKTIDELKSELEFKNLELKGLSDTLKQLEIKSSKVKFVDAHKGQPEEDKKLFSLSQAISVTKAGKVENEKDGKVAKVVVRVEKKKKSLGEKLKNLVVPGFFRAMEEESVVLMYETSPAFPDGLEHLRQDKLKWSGLPGIPSKLETLYPLVMDLIRENSGCENTISQIQGITLDILASLKTMLSYLCCLRINMKSEEFLVEDGSACSSLTVQDLLSDRLLKPMERGVDARRSLGLMCCIISLYGEMVEKFTSKATLDVFADIVKLIGQIRRPLEYTGVLGGILMYLQAALRVPATKRISEKTLKQIKQVIEDILFSRPKLDVLREVVKALTESAKCSPIFFNLCRKSNTDSCALYMDSHFNQALFFTPEACPLKLLQVQIKTLAHLSTSLSCQADITETFHSWFHSILVHSKTIPGWMLRENEVCCDVTECFCYLLSLLLPHAKNDLRSRNIVEKGVLVLREICRRSQKSLKNATLKLFPYALKSGGALSSFRKLPREAADWILAQYDIEAYNQESVVNWCGKSNSHSF